MSTTAKRNNPMRVALNAARGIENVADGEDDTAAGAGGAAAEPLTEPLIEPGLSADVSLVALNGHSPSPSINEAEELAGVPNPVRMGRPLGKRSDPNYMQMTAYIPIDLHEDIKEELLRVNRDRRRQKQPALEISDVVETQLAEWLRGQRAENAKR